MIEPDYDLQERVDRVIGEWLADNGGGIAADWMMVVGAVDRDGDEVWAYCTADAQPIQRTQGLVQWMEGVCSYEQFLYLTKLSSGSD